MKFLPLLALVLAGIASADYPVRAVTIVVPYSAGSDADLSARNLAAHAAKYLGKLVVVNEPGASGAIGSEAVRHAAPDGYTLLLARIASHVILPATDPKAPYRWTDFTNIALLEINPYVCAAGRDGPFASMKDLVETIRRRPGRIRFATVGPGTLQNFGPQYLFSTLGLPQYSALAVPYKGSGDLAVALLDGDVDFACSNLGALLPHFQAGTLRALMTTTRLPLKALPGTPTARSLGWPQMERLAAWSALAGPAKLPAEVIKRWTEALAKLARNPEWIAANEKLGGIPSIRSPAETESFLREQAELYERLVGRLGLRQP